MVCMSDIRGMREVVKVVEHCVATEQNLLLTGPPGIGKTMIARRITTIMPPLTDEQRVVLSGVYHSMGLLALDDAYTKGRPFRAPHHTVSAAGLAGTSKRPGEVDLASYGVLFLDELPEFSLGALNCLDGQLCRAKPAPMIVASSKPCPCGWDGSEVRTCLCSEKATRLFRGRTQVLCEMLQIKCFVKIPHVDLIANLATEEPAETSEVIRNRIIDQKQNPVQ